MPFQVSPGVNITEIDLTTIVPAVATTEGAMAGIFRWGPLDKILLVDSETTLVNRYGKPSNLNAETWFTAANFLAYGNKLYISRAANTTDNSGANGVLSAVANTTTVSDILLHVVKNEDHYLTQEPSFEAAVLYIAKYPGKLGNSLKISVCDSANQYASNLDFRAVDSNGSFNDANSLIAFTYGSNTATVTLANSAALANDTPIDHANNVLNKFSIGDIIEAGNSTIGKQQLKISALGTVLVVNSTGTNTGYATFNLSFETPYNLTSNYSSNSITRAWEYSGFVDRAPGKSNYVNEFGNTSANDELHVVVVDHGGKFTGVPGSVLEVFEGVSRASDARSEDGASQYYRTVINDNSKYVWWANDRSNSVANTADSVASSTNSKPLSLVLSQGSDGADESNVSISVLAEAYDKFSSAESVDISLVLQGKARGTISDNYAQLANYIIENVVEKRKDCMAFISPDRADVVNNSGKDEAQDVVAFRNSLAPSALNSTSYAVLDTGYKYQYDKYNDVYRFVPLNGDIAGLVVRTDDVRDPWWSPAGFNRGQIKNIVKLAYNPGKADRDILYKSGVNPVTTFPGQGTVLFGDKTLLSKPSAFDRINVRRLFIVLEKAISTAAKFTLFEFNDEFTRAQFRNLVEPYLRDIQGRRGIYDFRVVCDETNNTPEVIDRNEFVGDIYIKPARAINFIQLNFVAVRTGVEFSEIVGQF
jgi:hypothetical protein